MKKYVFIQPTVADIGGSQQYLYRKIPILEQNGWRVVVITTERGKIFIERLSEYDNYCIEELRFSTCFFNKRDIKKIVDKTIKYIDPQEGEEIVIESATASMALWSEIIAEKIKCRHFCFDFEEIFTNLTQTQLAYMDFKHKRKELCGITPRSLIRMFENYKKVLPEEAYSYRAMCSNPIDDAVSEKEIKLINELEKHEKVIGTIGRANKPFLIPTLLHIKKYIEEHPDVRYAVVLIGGAPQEKYEEEARNVFKNCENVDFYTTGMIFPISRKLLHICDVYVSSSGSASLTAREGLPTIAISPTTFKANGILNYTTRCSAIVEKETNQDVKELLYNILDEEYCKKNPNLGMYDEEDFEEEAKEQFDKQIMFIESNNEELEYYDVSKVKKEGKLKIVACFTRIAGKTIFMNALKFVKKSRLTFLKG